MFEDGKSRVYQKRFSKDPVVYSSMVPLKDVSSIIVDNF